MAPKKKKSDRAGLGGYEEMEGNVNRTLLEGGLSYESESFFPFVLFFDTWIRADRYSFQFCRGSRGFGLPSGRRSWI